MTDPHGMVVINKEFSVQVEGRCSKCGVPLTYKVILSPGMAVVENNRLDRLAETGEFGEVMMRLNPVSELCPCTRKAASSG